MNTSSLEEHLCIDNGLSNNPMTPKHHRRLAMTLSFTTPHNNRVHLLGIGTTLATRANCAQNEQR